MRHCFFILIVLLIIVSYSPLFGHPNYKGYSGSSYSNGVCASSCHGSTGGSIEVIGWPDEYIPGYTYDLQIGHASGESIKQFNGSCRIANSPEDAGTFLPGNNTMIYNVPNETHGICLSVSDQDTIVFSWTAPAMWVGTIELYISGLQGGYHGLNSTLVLTANEIAVDADSRQQIPDLFRNLANYPNPFNSSTVIEFTYNYEFPSAVHLGIYNLAGQLLKSIYFYCNESGTYSSSWDGISANGTEVPTGIYFYRVECPYSVNTNKMVILR